MEHHFTDYYVCIIVSLMMHSIIISTLFITLTPYNHLDFFKKTIEKKSAAKVILQEKAVTLPAPVLLSYGTGNNTSASPYNHSANQFKPDNQNKLEKQQEAPKAETAHQIIASHSDQKLPEKQEESKIEKQQSPTTITTDLATGFFKVSEKNSETVKKLDNAQEGAVRRRQLELADLFKTMPHYNTTEGNGSGNTKQLVVVQGDIKYYSFFNQFLTHINQVFAFHHGPEKIARYAQTAKGLKNAGLTVVIDQHGKVLSKSITSSSGYEPADALILQAVDQASPFPPVPQHFNHQTVRIELITMLH
jgi:TonB family protein